MCIRQYLRMFTTQACDKKHCHETTVPEQTPCYALVEQIELAKNHTTCGQDDNCVAIEEEGFHAAILQHDFENWGTIFKNLHIGKSFWRREGVEASTRG